MESQIRGLNMSIRNAKDGQSLVDTQEGALQEVTSILQRMRELAVQASSGAMTATDRGYLDTEMEALVDEVAAINANTKFNNTAVLTGTQFSFYTDIDVAGTTVSTVAANIHISGLGSFTASGGIHGLKKANVDINTVANTDEAVSNIDLALGSVASIRSNLGAVSNRFDHIIDNLTNVVANTEAAKSRVEDADFAVETTQLTRNTVLQQAATSMIAQANASKNTILALIQG
jgi:flagellin